MDKKKTKVDAISAGSKRNCTCLLAAGAIFAALGLCVAAPALALPTGSGTSCTYRGHTLAEGGSPGSLALNENSFSGDCGGNSAGSNGQVDVPVNAATTNVHSFYQSAFTTASASAGMGTLHAYSDSRATSSPKEYLYLTPDDTPAITPNMYRAIGDSSASANWWDTLSISGAYGAPIVLRFTITLSGEKSVVPGNAGDASFSANLWVDDGRRADIYNILSTSEPGTFSYTVGYRPGDEIRIFGSLSVRTNIAAGQIYQLVCSFGCWSVPVGYVPVAESIANAGNTAGFYIDVVSGAGSYSSLSGNSYFTAAPVPEPETYAMMLAGLGLLGFIARRRNQIDTAA